MSCASDAFATEPATAIATAAAAAAVVGFAPGSGPATAHRPGARRGGGRLCWSASASAWRARKEEKEKKKEKREKSASRGWTPAVDGCVADRGCGGLWRRLQQDGAAGWPGGHPSRSQEKAFNSHQAVHPAIPHHPNDLAARLWFGRPGSPSPSRPRPGLNLPRRGVGWPDMSCGGLAMMLGLPAEAMLDAPLVLRRVVRCDRARHCSAARRRLRVGA